MQGENSTGWDRNAFWYPTRDMTGGLLILFLLLLVFRFDELFGLHTSEFLVFGFWPAEFFYQFVMSLFHIAFAYMLYVHWPTPDEITEFADESDTE